MWPRCLEYLYSSQKRQHRGQGHREAIQQGTLLAARTQGLGDGLFEMSVQVGSSLVTVRGNIIDGVINIATAFIP